MKSFVYEIRDDQNALLYIGATSDPDKRLYLHIHSSNKFKGKKISMIIIKEFDSFKEALKFEGLHKIANGFTWSELENHKIAGKKSVESGHLERIRSLGGKIGGKTAGKIAADKPGFMKMIASKGGKGRKIDPNRSKFVKVQCSDGHITSGMSNARYCKKHGLNKKDSIVL